MADNCNTLSLEDACGVMVAAMVGSLYGYLPPIRPSVLISMQLPTYRGPCIWPSCQHKDACKGNRLEAREVRMELKGAGEEKELQGWLVAPHHKSNKWGTQRISCCCPMTWLTCITVTSCVACLPCWRSMGRLPSPTVSTLASSCGPELASL
jgi:hypothetical protein